MSFARVTDTAVPTSAVTATMPTPALVLSTHAGRGMHSIGDALTEDWAVGDVQHHAIESFLPEDAVRTDLERYRRIVFHAPWLLHLMYRVPWFYQRKERRERRGPGTPLDTLQHLIQARGVRTVVGVSHRATFWAGALKHRTGLDFALWGLEAEYGSSLAWRHVFWDQIDGFLTPQPQQALPYSIRAGTRVHQVTLPARRAFDAMRNCPGDPDTVLVTGGYWGLGPFLNVTRQLHEARPGLRILVVCGDNEPLRQHLTRAWSGSPDVRIFGAVPSLAPLMASAGSIVAKPGVSTIAESHAAGRQLFLLRGLPVAEDHNAAYALANTGARWFSVDGFLRWRAQHRA